MPIMRLEAFQKNPFILDSIRICNQWESDFVESLLGDYDWGVIVEDDDLTTLQDEKLTEIYSKYF